MSKVAVVGSFMMDLVARVRRRPGPGETVMGESFAIFPGGKGLNQAVTARRLGSEVWMVGRVGQDLFGDRFLAVLAEEGIHADWVSRDAEVGTGVGLPVLDAEGQNSIIVVPQANLRLGAADVEAAAPVIAAADVVLLQLEVAGPANARAVALARQAGRPVVLNPAPAGPLPFDLAGVAVITPNEVEAAALTGLPVGSAEEAARAGARLCEMGAAAAVVTLGGRGAVVVDAEGTLALPGFDVPVVDTTGAGDAFNGALAVGLAAGLPLRRAAALANAAGALAVTRLGAVPSMPDLAALRRFCAERGLPAYL